MSSGPLEAFDSPRSIPARQERLPGSVSAASDVFVAVRDGILQGTFAPGQSITESEIAKWLGVSRTPVREALRELEAQGLLTRRHRRLLVASLSKDQADNVYDVRLALETVALREAMSRHALEAVSAGLERTISDLRYEISTGDTAMALSVARSFHQLIYEATQNEMLIRFLGQVYNRVDQFRFYSSRGHSSARLLKTADEHAAITKAIRAGNSERAERLLISHLDASHKFDIKSSKDA